jgi:hypothetical protein
VLDRVALEEVRRNAELAIQEELGTDQLVRAG